jgi:exosome complex exonuclease RRP6
MAPQVRLAGLQASLLTTSSTPIIQIVEPPTDHQPENTTIEATDEASNAVEIPYVPASQRPAKQEEKDTIVIVGQVRQKRKRKVERSIESNPEASSAAKQSGDAELNTRRRGTNPEDPQEPFDFSSVPNILDDDPEAEGETEKRRKKQKKTNKKGLNR